MSQLYKPDPVTRYPQLNFTARKAGNLKYYSPAVNFFHYGTANGPLPCVNEVQIDYIKQRTGYVPQIRQKCIKGYNIKKGFISKKI